MRVRIFVNEKQINPSKVLPAKLKRAHSKQPASLLAANSLAHNGLSPEEVSIVVGDPQRSALQSAKNFLRRLYNTSTLRLRGGHKNQVKKNVDPSERFHTAMSPFYEMRLPEPEERPFLPYNIRYEVEEDGEEDDDVVVDVDEEDDEGAVFDSHGRLLMRRAVQNPLLCTPASTSSTGSTQLNHSSPDEGMFSGGEESTVSSTRSSNVDETMDTSNIKATYYPPRPSSGLSSSTTASSSVLNSTFSSSGLNTTMDSIHGTPPVKRATPSPAGGNQDKFRNWNDLFDHLKKEITDMRARDAQILHNLKTIEEELNLVKQGSTATAAI